MKELRLWGPDGARGDVTYASVRFCDERSRAGREVSSGAVASVTLDSDHPDDPKSWGEFLTLDEVARLHAWTGALLTDYFREGVDCGD